MTLSFKDYMSTTGSSEISSLCIAATLRQTTNKTICLSQIKKRNRNSTIFFCNNVKVLPPPLTFCNSLCVWSPKLVQAKFQLLFKSKERETGVLWAVCDEWLLRAKICGALVYSRNIMYHKFLIHFSSSKITFYPIRLCFLCWLKGTLKQTVLQPLLNCSPSSTFLTVLPSPPLGWSLVSFLLFPICVFLLPARFPLL